MFSCCRNNNLSSHASHESMPINGRMNQEDNNQEILALKEIIEPIGFTIKEEQLSLIESDRCVGNGNQKITWDDIGRLIREILKNKRLENKEKLIEVLLGVIDKTDVSSSVNKNLLFSLYYWITEVYPDEWIGDSPELAKLQKLISDISQAPRDIKIINFVKRYQGDRDITVLSPEHIPTRKAFFCQVKALVKVHLSPDSFGFRTSDYFNRTIEYNPSATGHIDEWIHKMEK